MAWEPVVELRADTGMEPSSPERFFTRTKPSSSGSSSVTSSPASSQTLVPISLCLAATLHFLSFSAGRGGEHCSCYETVVVVRSGLTETGEREGANLALLRPHGDDSLLWRLHLDHDLSNTHLGLAANQFPSLHYAPLPPQQLLWR